MIDYRPWTEYEISVLHKMVEAGHTATEIGRAIGRSRNAVMGQRFRRNIRVEPPPRLDPLPVSQGLLGRLNPTQRVAELLANHYTRAECAARLNKSRSWIDARVQQIQRDLGEQAR